MSHCRQTGVTRSCTCKVAIRPTANKSFLAGAFISFMEGCTFSKSVCMVGNFSEVFIFVFFASQEPFAKIKTAKISEIGILAYFVKNLPARGHQCCARDYSDQDCTVRFLLNNHSNIFYNFHLYTITEDIQKWKQRNNNQSKVNISYQCISCVS